MQMYSNVFPYTLQINFIVPILVTRLFGILKCLALDHMTIMLLVLIKFKNNKYKNADKHPHHRFNLWYAYTGLWTYYPRYTKNFALLPCFEHLNVEYNIFGTP